MCYSVMYDREWSDLEESLGRTFSANSDSFEPGLRVFPRKPYGVLVLGQKGLTLKSMSYSLVPPWSEKPMVPWATYNARITREHPKTKKLQRIFEVPTWKGSFGRWHCAVPMTHFFESCREGEAAGYEVAFESRDQSPLFAAGLFSVWKNKTDDSVFLSFSVITQEPDPFLLKVGHDRSPLFLSREKALNWVEEKKLLSPKEAFDFLNKNKKHPELTYEKIRELKT